MYENSRDLHIFKETYISEKRPVYMQNDLYAYKETCMLWKETFMHKKRERGRPQEVGEIEALYAVASISWIDKIIGLFCERAL